MSRHIPDADERAAVADRIRLLADEFETRAEAARVAGISTQQLHNLMSGKSSPSLFPIARLAEATGRTLDWVVSGAGSEWRAPADPAVHRDPTDAELFGRLVDAIGRVYREEGVRLPSVELGRIAAEEYDAIVAATSDSGERRAGARMVAERIRRALRTERPASRKRGA